MLLISQKIKEMLERKLVPRIWMRYKESSELPTVMSLTTRENVKYYKRTERIVQTKRVSVLPHDFSFLLETRKANKTSTGTAPSKLLYELDLLLDKLHPESDKLSLTLICIAFGKFRRSNSIKQPTITKFFSKDTKSKPQNSFTVVPSRKRIRAPGHKACSPRKKFEADTPNDPSPAEKTKSNSQSQLIMKSNSQSQLMTKSNSQSQLMLESGQPNRGTARVTTQGAVVYDRN